MDMNLESVPPEDSDTVTKLWKFKVKYEPKYAEKVCIIGDCKLLGRWKAENLIPLSYDEVAKLWYIDIKIPADRDVHYRYVTCTSEIVDHVLKTKIHQWETNLNPRKVKREETSNYSNDAYDVFGKFGDVEKLENGWLIDDVAVFIRLNSKSIEWMPAGSFPRTTMIKLRNSVKYTNAASSNSERSSDVIFISTSNGDGKYHEQDADGYSYFDTEEAVFMTRTFTVDNQRFVFEFTDTNIKSGYSEFVLNQKFHGSMGNMKIPIHSVDHEHLGNLDVNYLIVRPPPVSFECTCKSSFAKYWNNSWTPLEIGHRGSGMSYSNSPTATLNHKYRENTIASFNSAGKFGANLVEFDVQLTSDLVPTVYHDFNVLLEVQHKKPNSQRKLILPFHELSYEDLKDFKTQHVKEIDGAIIFEYEVGEESTPFPTLKEVLNSVDPEIGFNIEIKHVSQSQEESSDFHNSIDMNVYVDRILEVVFQNAGSRYIVFSSFSPNICLMAKLKQNKYPVMLLTRPVTITTHAPTSDERAKNIRKAINFAKGADMLGIVAAAEDLVQNLELVKMILDCNITLFCWGDVFHDKENIKLLKAHGAHGIIFDRIDLLGENLKKDITLNESIL